MSTIHRVYRVVGISLFLAMIGCGSGTNGQEPAGATPEAANAAEGSGDPANVPTADDSCKNDVDCVPAQCCHAKSCTTVSQAPPECAGMMCTAECVPGTMDCGKGKCACQAGQCQVQWRE